MRESITAGFSFGVTSSVVTTLGLLVGLYSSTQSVGIVIVGVLTIAIADSFSDALGVHIAEESKHRYSHMEVWQATIAALLTKIVFSLTFLIPILLFELKTAVIVSVVYGCCLIAMLSYLIAPSHRLKTMVEHLTITVLVVVITYYVGEFVSGLFVA